MTLIKKPPSIEEKLEILGGEARHDISCGTCGEGRKRSPQNSWIYPAILPDGRTQYMLKTLMTNACVNNCAYCAQRASSPSRRTAFKAEELARFFESLLRKRLVGALFLSSAIGGNPVAVMDNMLKCAEIVRYKLRFNGYLHLKLLPGIESGQIERAVALAERVSVNLEAPSDDRLKIIAPEKRLKGDLLPLIEKANELIKNKDGKGFRCRGITTQFVVGAAGESDREIIATGAALYNSVGEQMKRLYFSAYTPVEDSPLEDVPPAPLWRENRLYQADFLLRKYGFSASELVFDDNGMFSEESDPKEAWATAHPERFPIEINAASFLELLRVPGIGPKTAKEIVEHRPKMKITDPLELKKLGARAEKASLYLLFNGKRKSIERTLPQLKLPL
ncbi:MAG: putative DNA modification/repair radical SAM protein [Myxococcota bacterium]